MNCKHHPETAATHTAVLPDPDKPGNNLNECGYSKVGLCSLCAAEYARDAGDSVRVAVICPSCKGKRFGWGFMCGPGNGRTGDIPCSTCKTTGEITHAHAQRIEEGKSLRRNRLERRVTQRTEAKRLGISVGEWSHIEHGDEPETEAGARALERRWKEMEEGQADVQPTV